MCAQAWRGLQNVASGAFAPAIRKKSTRSTTAAHSHPCVGHVHSNPPLLAMRLSLSTLVLLACFHHAGAAETEAELDALPLVAVTGTWSDLAKQPPITLANGSILRLGIETLAAPAQRGALIYLLGEGEMDENAHRCGDLLGPLTLEQLQPLAACKLQLAQSATQSGHNGPITLRLWARRISAPAGTTVTWLARLQQRPVARIRLHGTTEMWQPWSPLCRSTQKQNALKENGVITIAASTGPTDEGSHDYGAFALIGPDANAARPPFDGSFPCLALPGQLFDRPALAAAALPQLDPTTATVATWRSGDDIHLALPEPIDTILLREHVLARWWLNGKAVLPAQGAQGLLSAECYSGMSQLTSHLVFSFAGLAPEFAAPSRAEIAVEFLVVPQGWEIDDNVAQAQRATMSTESAVHSGPQRSNRLCWTLPK